MGKQAHILSFDDAKRVSGARRPSAPASKRADRRRSAGASAYADQRSRSSARGSTAASRYAGVSSPSDSPSPYRSPSSSRSSYARPLPREVEAGHRAVAPSRAAVTTFDDSAPRSGRSGSAGRGVRGAHARLADADDRSLGADQPEQEAEEAGAKRSRLAEFRQRRRKERAEKKFSRQFGDAPPAGDAPTGSRAAVYKTEMGASHKRAARLQSGAAAAAGSAAAKLGPLAALSAWRQSPKFIASMGVVVCLALTCWFLYTPAQQFYHSVREHDRLQAEYAAVEQRNALLQAEVSALGTDAGIEDRAHEQFGWVPEGFQTANVRGLSSAGDDASNFTANIVPGSIEAPETWYSPFLDALFGVK